MDNSQIGKLIKSLRVEREMTQLQLADRLGVSDKTVSKWERGAGLPDISLLPQLAEVFEVDAENILAGELMKNTDDGGNMKRVKFYVCPDCGDILTSTGKADISCCGRKLTALEAKPIDDRHRLHLDCSGHDCYVTFNHEMSKSSFVSFIACVDYDTVLIKRLYPEQLPETHIPILPWATLYCYCAEHGFMKNDQSMKPGTANRA